MNLERKSFELNCLSPVHIGSGETLKAFEYLYDRKTCTVYFLDEAKWIAFLDKNNLIDKFFEYIEKVSAASKGRVMFVEKNLWEWLKENGIANPDLHKLAIRQSEADTNTIVSKRSLNDIDCHIALADGTPYIPGSSLKGLFRTAILHAEIKKMPALAQRYWKKIVVTTNLDLHRQNSECARISRELENELLAKLDYTVAERFNRRVPAEVKSVLRGLMVSDAVCTELIDTVILQRLDATTKTNHLYEAEKTLPLFHECIPANTRLKFSMTLDFDILSAIGISSFEQVFQMARDFMLDGVERLEKVFGNDFHEQFEEAKTADALIGGGVGFLTKTLIYSLAPSHEEAKKIAADYFDKAFTFWNSVRHYREPAHWHEACDKEIAPRTLKLTRSQTAKSLLGLVQFRELPC